LQDSPAEAIPESPISSTNSPTVLTMFNNLTRTLLCEVIS
jgi:hypothetical protein